MIITNIKVYIARNGDGAISYQKNKITFRVLISKDDNVIMEIFDRYFSQLKSFKNRHYAIAKWIVRDIRTERYVFRSYSNNNLNIRPVKQFSVKQKNLYTLYSKSKLARRQIQMEFSDFERLVH